MVEGYLENLLLNHFKILRRPRGNMGFFYTHANYQFHKAAVLNGKDFVMQYTKIQIGGLMVLLIDQQLKEFASSNESALRSIVECVVYCRKHARYIIQRMLTLLIQQIVIILYP